MPSSPTPCASVEESRSQSARGEPSLPGIRRRSSIRRDSTDFTSVCSPASNTTSCASRLRCFRRVAVVDPGRFARGISSVSIAHAQHGVGPPRSRAGLAHFLSTFRIVAPRSGFLSSNRGLCSRARGACAWFSPNDKKSPALVFVVEDELLVRWAIAETLGHAGRTVIEAETGRLRFRLSRILRSRSTRSFWITGCLIRTI